MQHLDEGTIHSWLDGALAPDEAARVEAHVAECAECAAAVAEARGFIAASSRILTKLDDVPAGVVPGVRPIRRRNVAAWRAAAAVLVIAVGSLVVIRNRETAATADSARPAAGKEIGFADTAHVVAGLNDTVHPQSQAAASSKAPIPPAVAKVSPARARDERRQDRAVEGPVTAAGTANSAVAAAAPFAADAMADTQLRRLKEERAPGGTRTLYAVAKGDTVTLFEAAVTELQSVVTTGASVRRALSPPTVGERTAKAPQIAVDTGTVRESAAGAIAQGAVAKSAASAPPRAQASTEMKTVRTISWMDATSGRMLTLSGRLPVDQLEDIKRKIEQERAATAARKPAR